MTPEQIEKTISLQKIDCNCNDCKFMTRDSDRHNQSLELHKKWQLDRFYLTKNNLLKKAKEWRVIWNDLENFENLSREADKMTFVFNRNEASINYGNCTRFNKAVSFLPNTCQLETQNCFEHRR